MTGDPLWDAILWGVIGLAAGVALTWGRGYRSALVFAVAVSVLGVLAALTLTLVRGGDGLGPALAVLFATVPCSLGLALGGLLVYPLRRR